MNDFIIILMISQAIGNDAASQIPHVFPLASLMWPYSPHPEAQEFLMVHAASSKATRTTPWSSWLPHEEKTPLSKILYKIWYTVELPVVSINSYGDWSLYDGWSEGFTVTFRDVRKAGDLEFIGLFWTLLISSSVWVLSFSGDTAINNVLESEIHQTTLTASVTVCTWTIAQFLLGQTLKSLTGNSKSRFDSSDCGECPTWTTLTLVLDGVDDTFISPINRVGDSFTGSLVDWSRLSFGGQT